MTLLVGAPSAAAATDSPLQPRPQPPSPYLFLPHVPRFAVRSDDIADRQRLSTKHVFSDPNWGYTGQNQSPHLEWSGFPRSTKGFAVTCFDPDAPTVSGFWHWLLVNIPLQTTSLPTGVAGDNPSSALPAGSFHVTNDFGIADYSGAAPPAVDKPHRYIFVVHALDTDFLGVDASTSAAIVQFNLTSHAVARAMITPVFGSR